MSSHHPGGKWGEGHLQGTRRPLRQDSMWLRDVVHRGQAGLFRVVG